MMLWLELGVNWKLLVNGLSVMDEVIGIKKPA